MKRNTGQETLFGFSMSALILLGVIWVLQKFVLSFEIIGWNAMPYVCTVLISWIFACFIIDAHGKKED